MSFSVFMGAIELGFIFSILALGIFISFRILDIPDLTVDGSFTLGVAVSVVCAYNGHPVWGIILSIIAGLLAGVVTGILQTKMKIQPILAGILTMTALYSVNLRIMGKKPNISLYSKDTIFNIFIKDKDISGFVITLLILVVASLKLYWFLKTQLGMSLRATGDNEYMVRASSIDSDKMKIMGFAISNAFVALSGGVLAQYQNFADANGGVGMLVIGLASIIIGEAIFGRRSILFSMIAAIVGAIIYRFILSIALLIGMEAVDLKLFSAIIVAIAIFIPQVKKIINKRKENV